MLGGKGFYRGSTILVSGTAGTGKSSLGAVFADAACRRHEKCLYFSFEESPSEFMRNMRSIGVDLEAWRKKGLLSFSSSRPTSHGLEMHLALMHKLVEEFRPSVAVVDPISNFIKAGARADAQLMLVRLVDFLKSRNVTALLTSLTGEGSDGQDVDTGISSVVDTWLVVQDIEGHGERNRGLNVLKSRGTAHSNQVREFLLTDHGIELLDVYTGPEGVLVGAARLAREARDRAEAISRQKEVDRRTSELARRRTLMEQQVSALRAEFQAHVDEVRELIATADTGERQRKLDRTSMAKLRRAEPAVKTNSGKAVPRSG
jgi:circadian clock protein KaiC